MTRAAVLTAMALLISAFSACGPKLTPDEKAVKRVLSDYTGALRKGDYPVAYACLSRASQEHIALSTFADVWTRNLTTFAIRSFSVPQASVLHLSQGDYATAIVERALLNHTTGKKEVARLDYHLKKEDGGWRILRTNELDDEWARSLASGDSAEAVRLAAICVQVDPVVATSPSEYINRRKAEWEQDAAGAAASTQSTSPGSVKGSPTSVAVKITKAGLEDYSFAIKYTVTNVSQAPVSDITVKAIFKKPGTKEILEQRTDHPVSFNEALQPGYSKVGEISCFRQDKSISKVNADLSVSVGNSDWKLVQGDIDLSVPRVAHVVQLKVTNVSFERTMAATLAEYIYSPRLDYRVTNVGTDTLEYLAMKAVWKSPTTGEVVTEDNDYIVWSGGSPLAPGESRTGYVTCGRGSAAGPTARTVDIYLARLYDEYELMKSGVSIP